ncbi:MAG: DnaJ domain-containing protein [Armatimonadota bacterium]|nr:DnaJ domain-containing protein [Armatimonadota bacterium]
MEIDHGEPDLYATLQVHERAIPEVIDKAYRVLVRKYHPDVHPAEKRSWAHGKMTQLNIAYDVLSDPEKRAEYDASRRLGRRSAAVADEVETEAEARTLKCFNHPKRPAVTFCWHCGRPICAECFGGEQHGHTICVPCMLVLEREKRWRAGMDVEEDEPRRREGRAMGLPGVIAHYTLLMLMLGAILWGVYNVALGFGNTPTQATTLVVGLATVFLVFVVQRLTWRVICPECKKPTGHAGFRAKAPWNEFLNPHPICPHCGRRFTSAELNQTFD